MNLKRDKRLAVIVNCAAIFVFALSVLVLSIFAAWVRPDMKDLSVSITAGGAVVVIALMAIVMPLHELIHGLLFWVVTRSKPVFGLRLFYAYASAPDWYIPTRRYALVVVGPLVIIGAVGVLIMLLVPVNWAMAVMLLVALNASGAAGDLLILARLLELPPICLAKDSGDAITFYGYQSR